MKTNQFRLIIIAFLCTLSNAFAQTATLKFGKSLGGTLADAIVSSAIDTAGNTYMAGYFKGTADLNPGAANTNTTAVGETDMFISKIDKNGNLIWLKIYGSTLSEYPSILKLDNSGNIYLAGTAPTILDFDLGSGVAKLTYNSDFLLKLDKDGNYSSLKPLTGLHINDLCFDNSNNIYLAGYFYGNNVDLDPSSSEKLASSNAGSNDIFITKLNAVGNCIWAKQFGGADDDNLKSIAVNPYGIYFTGTFQGTADFDPGAATKSMVASGHHDIYVCKLFLNGDLFWVDQFGSNSAEAGEELCSGLVIDNTGYVYTAGNFNNTFDFDPGAGKFEMSSGNGAGFLLKLNNAGEFVRAITFGITNYDEAINAISIDKNNYIAVVGTFLDSIELDPKEQKNKWYSKNPYTAFISILDTSFQFLGGFVFGYHVHLKNIHILKGFQIITTGYALGDFDCDPGKTVSTITNSGASDGFLAMYEFDKLTKNKVITKPSFIIYPNPIKDQLNIKPGQIIKGDTRLTITDIQGREIQNLGIYKPGDEWSLSMAANPLPNGMYLLQLSNAEFQKAIPIFIDK